MIAATTPTGSRSRIELPSSSRHSYSAARWPQSAKVIVGRPTWIPLERARGIPTSLAMMRASSSERSASFSEIRVRNSPRSLGLVAAHAGKAAAAARTAASASAGVPAGTVA